MTLIRYLAGAALLGLGAFTLGSALDYGSSESFALTAGSLMLVGAVRDYSPRRPRWEPVRRTAGTRFPSRAHVIRRTSGAKVAA